MLFSKITLLSLVAIATALPNAIPEPEPEPAQLEARTWNWKWNYNKCECDCPYQNYKRDENGLEARTLWLLPNFWDKNSCQHGCDNYCKDAYKKQEKKCKDDAENAYKHCKKQCKNGGYYKREPTYTHEPSCKDKCKTAYEEAVHACENSYSHY